MITNRILLIMLPVLVLPLIPVQIVSTLLLGLGVSLTFGLLLLPISLIWMGLLFPMVGLSWVCHKVPALRDVIGIVFVPWVIVAYIFVGLMPSMGEIEDRAAKLMLCESWPFTWQFWQFLSRKIDADPSSVDFHEVVNRVSRRDPIKQRVLVRVAAGQQLDPDT